MKKTLSCPGWILPTPYLRISCQPWSRGCRLLALLFGFAAWADHSVTSAEDNPLPRILRDWEKRRQDVGLVVYRYSGTRTWPQGAYNDMTARAEKSSSADATADNPEKDVTGIVKISATLDFRNNRCRIESEEDDYFPSRRALYRMRLLTVGNEGIRTTQILEKTEPTAQKVDFVIAKGDAQSEFILDRRYHLPMVFASGVVPTRDQRVKESNFALEVDSEAFAFERYTEEQGRTLAVLRVDDFGHGGYRATNHYWVDLERNSAIVKYTGKLGESGSNGSVLNIEYGLTDGVWLPTRWTRTYIGVYGRKGVTESVTVSETARLSNVSNETFVVKPSPGMQVVEYEYSRDSQSKELLVQETSFVQNPDGSRGEQHTKSQNSRRRK